MNVTAPALNLAPLLDVQGCCKSFRKPDGDELLVLENVNLTLRPGDLITIGTPAGVAKLAPGDKLKGRIERVGEMTLGVEGEK